MPDQPLAREIFDSLHRVMRAQRQRMHPQSLTPGETFILAQIHHHGSADGVRVSDIAARMRVSTSGITQFVKSLEARGLVERTRSEVDRRVVLLRATKAGRDLMQASLDRMVATFSRLVETMGHEQSVELRDHLSRVAGFLERESDSEGEATC